jgi:hypothetical protein
MGRPQKDLSEEQIKQIEVLASVLTIEQLSDYFGISHDTFSRICERNPDVLRKYKKGKSKAIGNIANSLLTKAREGDLTAQMFYLKTQAGWRETNRLEHSGPDGGPLKGKIEIEFVNAGADT